MSLDRNTAYGDESFSDNRGPLFPGDINIGWGFGLSFPGDDESLLHTPIAPPFEEEPEHCTGSPTCQCSDCRLTEFNSGQPPEDQLPHGYKYESPITKASREVGLYAMDESQQGPDAQGVYHFQEVPLTDPACFAVSELEQRVEQLEARNTDDYALALGGRVNLLEAEVARARQAITDLEERLRSLTLVVNVLVEQKEMHEKTLHNVLDTLGMLVVRLPLMKEGETN